VPPGGTVKATSTGGRRGKTSPCVFINLLSDGMERKKGGRELLLRRKELFPSRKVLPKGERENFSPKGRQNLSNAAP